MRHGERPHVEVEEPPVAGLSAQSVYEASQRPVICGEMREYESIRLFSLQN